MEAAASVPEARPAHAGIDQGTHRLHYETRKHYPENAGIDPQMQNSLAHPRTRGDCASSGLVARRCSMWKSDAFRYADGTSNADLQSSTCSTTCTAAARPNRASSARGSGPVLTIVPVASSAVSRPPEAFDSDSRQRLLALVVQVVEHRHVDRLRRFACLEGLSVSRAAV